MATFSKVSSIDIRRITNGFLIEDKGHSPHGNYTSHQEYASSPTAVLVAIEGHLQTQATQATSEED